MTDQIPIPTIITPPTTAGPGCRRPMIDFLPPLNELTSQIRWNAYLSLLPKAERYRKMARMSWLQSQCQP